MFELLQSDSSVLHHGQLRDVIVSGADFKNLAVSRPATRLARRFLTLTAERAAPVSCAVLSALVR